MVHALCHWRTRKIPAFTPASGLAAVSVMTNCAGVTRKIDTASVPQAASLDRAAPFTQKVDFAEER